MSVEKMEPKIIQPEKKEIVQPQKMGLLVENPVYKPFRYPWCYDAWLTQQRIHWLPEEVPLGDDVRDWQKNLTQSEKNLLTQIFRFFTQADVEVQNCYLRHYTTVFKPTEVLMMMTAFASMETVRNRYLVQLLEKYKKNTEEVWSGITTNEGSVSHLDFLTDLEKDVFKTAFELDQKWIIELSGDRTPYISQAQSINLFVPADIHKRELHKIHFDAWKKGLKSLYYCRSKSIQRAENVNDTKATDVTANVYKSKSKTTEQPEYEECLSCQ
jgi:hypothetical protein